MDNKILRDKLVSFYKITEELISEIKEEKHENISELFLKRQQIIDELEKDKCSKEEFQKIASEIKLLELNKQLEACFYSKKNEMKLKINNLMHQKNANNNYMKNSNKMRNFFNTKV